MRKLSFDPEFGNPQKFLPAPQSSVDGASKRQALSPALAHILEEVQRELGYGKSHGEEEELPSTRELEGLVRTVAQRLGFELSNYERDEILSHLEREQKPFGVLQDLVDDPQVSDIIVTHYQRVAVQQGRRNYTTGVAFSTQDAYDAFVERLLQKAGTTYSTKKPIADGMIGSFARIHAVHRSLCESGPYLTIRLNRFSRVEISDLVKLGMAPQAVFSYLQGLVYAGKTLLLVGEVGTGKTTLSRALAGSIPQEEAILVIEDTPEIRLEHPHVRYVTTREANADGAGRVSPSECIRAGMRMAMNRIIFGEMRDAEAAEAFIDVCASGHPGISTIHARTAGEAVARLELFLGRSQRGVERQVLTQQIATAVQAVVFVDICHETGARRVMNVVEIGPVADGVLRQREIFKYELVKAQNSLSSSSAGGEWKPAWKVAHRVSAHREELEALESPVLLSGLPALLELPEKREPSNKAADPAPQPSLRRVF